MCWSGHQLCLCCGRNTAESCRKWSKSTGEYDYIDACWSSCALCSDDAYKILNTPVVYNEKIIDPELLLPLDAELLYYSIQSAKRQREKQTKSPPATTGSPPRGTGDRKGGRIPFADLTGLIAKPRKPRQSPSKPRKKSRPKKSSKSPRPSRAPRKVRSSKAVRPKKSSRSSRKSAKKKNRKTPRKPSRSSRSRSKSKKSRSRSKSRSRRSKRGSKKSSSRSKRRSKSRR